jgi:arylformamidase
MIWLSHPLSQNTPAYANGKGLEVAPSKQLCEGDSCNQLYFAMSNHLGTHVDAPKHFVEAGMSVTDYAAKDWVFDRPFLIDVPTAPGETLSAAAIDRVVGLANDADLLLIRTGFEQYRSSSPYWQESPIIHSDVITVLDQYFPKLKAIALDTISISSLLDREMGRATHKVLLSRGLRIFEDVALAHIEKNLKQVMAFPLLLDDADGAPVSMVGIY